MRSPAGCDNDQMVSSVVIASLRVNDVTVSCAVFISGISELIGTYI